MSDDSIASLPPLPESVTAGRLPDWNLERLVHRSCPICGSGVGVAVVRRPDSLMVARCEKCGMLYLPDIPCPEEVEAFYRQYSSFKQCSIGRSFWLKCRLDAMRDSNIKLLEATGGVKRKLLVDIGCSNGNFLRIAKQSGASVFGIELDENALAHLNRIGISAAKNIPRLCKADIITGFQLIEHLANPAELVQQVSQALVDDGRLLLAFPNAEEANRCGPGWIGFRVDLEHFNYFSLSCLSTLLMKHDLFVENVWTHGQPGITRLPRRGGIMERVRDRMMLLSAATLEGPFKHYLGAFGMVVLARKTRATLKKNVGMSATGRTTSQRPPNAIEY
jgi:SAM-dependent methyltransferase